MATSDQAGPGRMNRRWAHRGGSFDLLPEAVLEVEPLPPPAPDEVIARVEAVSICSSDIKVVRMGSSHPLLANGDGRGVVLGHELSLRVHDVGSAQTARFRKGQRISLQPAMRINGRRSIVGFDLAGGFAQYLRLGPEALADYVFEVPETLTAAEIAMLEPYGCVERAYRPNARQAFRHDGSALVLFGPNADRHHASRPLGWKRLVVAGPLDAPLPDFVGPVAMRCTSITEVSEERFDDILALGDIDAGSLAALPTMLAEGGLLLQARRSALGPVPVDAARIHYDALSFVGTSDPDILQALAPGRQRFDVKPGGVALVHGAGGAMGRIHVHRLLQLEQGPRTIVATSRKGRRLADLETDFGPVADAMGRRLIVAENEQLGTIIDQVAPGGLDDAVVVAPDSEAVAAAAGWLAPDGLLAVFAGFPYGGTVPFDLAGIATTGKRITGSTGCSVEDMRDVLSRAVRGDLNLTANLKAVAGLNALPHALDAVNRGTVSGKIVVYPQSPDLPMRVVTDGWRIADEEGLTNPEEPT
ncbi:alcohol dehydrogenase catalytic domain-containing protein [Arenibaculum pallidiluteum]|uniref:alcohol dehydrogenase catalytic domain-containing protein n=1 Tax=Arenibaculum pallidiluteum TaxID=2812559 RepID=UPI001A97515C|nr:alcohol dehydrogenase catalytic domain-containing protein [Arenibaculum pallidiluteum]